VRERYPITGRSSYCKSPPMADPQSSACVSYSPRATRAFQRRQGLKDSAQNAVEKHLPGVIPQYLPYAQKASALLPIEAILVEQPAAFAFTHPPRALQAHANGPPIPIIVVPCTLSETLSITWSVSHIPFSLSSVPRHHPVAMSPSTATGPDNRACLFHFYYYWR
jgi:hypothetical protein